MWYEASASVKDTITVGSKLGTQNSLLHSS